MQCCTPAPAGPLCSCIMQNTMLMRFSKQSAQGSRRELNPQQHNAQPSKHSSTGLDTHQGCVLGRLCSRQPCQSRVYASPQPIHALNTCRPRQQHSAQDKNIITHTPTQHTAYLLYQACKGKNHNSNITPTGRARAGTCRGRSSSSSQPTALRVSRGDPSP